MIDFGKSEQMIKISGKVDKSNTYDGFSCNITFFIQRKLVVFDLPTFPLIFIT